MSESGGGGSMPYYMYVSLQDDDKIVVFTMDAGTGKLTPKGEVPVSGGPSPLTMSPDRKVLYVGHRTVPGISSFRIDPHTGALTQSGTVAPEAAPTFRLGGLRPLRHAQQGVPRHGRLDNRRTAHTGPCGL